MVKSGIEVNPSPAQGSGGANYGQTMFFDHAVVKIDAKPATIYDPSYGSASAGASMAAAEIAWEDASILKYHVLYYNPTTSALSPVLWFFDTKGDDEVVFMP